MTPTAASKSCPTGKKLTSCLSRPRPKPTLPCFSGQATFGFLDSQIADYVVSTSKGVFKSVGSAVNVAPYGSRHRRPPAGSRLAKAIQAAVKTLIANGTYAPSSTSGA